MDANDFLRNSNKKQNLSESSRFHFNRVEQPKQTQQPMMFTTSARGRIFGGSENANQFQQQQQQTQPVVRNFQEISKSTTLLAQSNNRKQLNQSTTGLSNTKSRTIQIQDFDSDSGYFSSGNSECESDSEIRTSPNSKQQLPQYQQQSPSTRRSVQTDPEELAFLQKIKEHQQKHASEKIGRQQEAKQFEEFRQRHLAQFPQQQQQLNTSSRLSTSTTTTNTKPNTNTNTPQKTMDNFQPSSVSEEQAIAHALKMSVDSHKNEQLIKSLPQLWTQQNVSEKQRSIRKIVSPEAFRSLQGESQISSDAINAFVQLIAEKANENKQSKHDVQTLDTYFCSYLVRYNQPTTDSSLFVDGDSVAFAEQAQKYSEEQIRRYTARLRFSKNSMFIIPIHTPGHWVLAIVDLKAWSVEFYDSYSVHNNDKWFPFWKQMIFSWLSTFAPEAVRKTISKKSLSFESITEKSKHQTTGLGCGAFVCYYAMNRALGKKSASELANDNLANPQFISNVMKPYLQQVLQPFVEHR